MSFRFNLLTLNIELRAGPSRKVTIPDFYTFGHLHQLIVFLFEWDDSHLHRFEVPKQSCLSATDMDLLWLNQLENHLDSHAFTWVSNPMSFLRTGEQKEINEQTVDLQYAFQKIGNVVGYEYDFCSSWRAQISLNNIEPIKVIKRTDFKPRINIVGGKGNTISEYNQKQLNQDIAKMAQFVYFPLNTNTKSISQNNNHNKDELIEEKKTDQNIKSIARHWMITHKIDDQTENSNTLINLSDDLLIFIINYLKFTDIMYSVLKLSKRFYTLNNNRHLLYSLKNFPFGRRKSFDLLQKYCSYLIKTKQTNYFIYKDIKILKWVNIMMDDLYMDENNETPTCVLFKNLYSLK
eukprot:137271_1